MLTDPMAIQKLALRSDLPRLNREGFFLFAQFEPAEQLLEAEERWQLLARALPELVAYEERNAERPLPKVLPRAYKIQQLSEDWVELEYACDLAEPYERRNRAGNVLAVTNHLKVRARIFKGAFAYFAHDDSSPVASIDVAGFVALSTDAR